MQLVKQITMMDNKGNQESIRYNVKTSLLYRQNRSYDRSMKEHEFVTTLHQTIKTAESRGHKITVLDVPINSKWPISTILTEQKLVKQNGQY